MLQAETSRLPDLLNETMCYGILNTTLNDFEGLKNRIMARG